MEHQILEGTWEEIIQRGDEFSGKRVRITVLPDSSASDETPLSVLLERLTGVIDSAELSGTFPRKRSAYGDGVVEKFRKQGLRLP